MKKDIWIAVLVAAVAVLAVVVVKQNRQLARLNEQLTAALAQKVKETAVAVPNPESVEPVAEVAPRETSPTPPSSSQASSGSASNFFAGMAGMMKDPQMKEMIRAQQKMALDRMYGSLFKQLNWPAGDVDKLKDLLLERQMALAEAGMSMMSGSAEDRQRAVEETKTVKADYDKKLQDFFGPEGYKVFQDYDNTVGERMQIGMFKDSLPSDAALSEQQESDLIAVMYEERQALPPSSLLNNKTADPSQLSEENIAAALKQLEQLQQRYAERAAEILSPAQLEQFSKWQQQWSAMQAAGLKMASQMFGNKGTATTSSSAEPTP